MRTNLWFAGLLVCLLLMATAIPAQAADYELYGGGGGGGGGASGFAGGGGGSAGNSVGAGGGGQGSGVATSMDINNHPQTYGGAGGAGGGEGAAATGPGMLLETVGGNGSGGNGNGTGVTTGTAGGAGAVNGTLSGGTGGTAAIAGRKGGGGGGAGSGSLTSAGGAGGAAAAAGSAGTNGGGGGGGSSANAGNPSGFAGGNGSATNETMAGGAYDAVRLAGGGGGGGGSSYHDGGAGGGSGGGGGGTAAATAGGAISASSITLTGGKGGDGGHNLKENIGITGGAGGAAGLGGAGGGATGSAPYYGGGGGGGGGGKAILNAAGQSVTVSGSLSLTSGAKGADGQAAGGADATGIGLGGAGGDVTFSVGTLSAPTINLTKTAGGGNLSFAATTLNANVDTAFNLSGTAAGDVNVTTLNLSNNSLLSLNNTAGAMTINTLSIGASQSGRLFVANGSQQAFGALNANGANLTFVLPAGVTANQTIVSVANADLDNATIGVNDANGRVNMTVGQSIKLLAASTSLTAANVNLSVQTANGDIFDVQVNSNDITLLLQYLSPTNPEYARLKAYAEGRAATLAFVNQGQELIINQGFGSALAATAGPGFRFNAFGGMGGGKSRYNSGSHVDVEGFSMLAGLAVGNDLGLGRLTLGAFFEGGWGSYDSHNSFSNYASVNGDGDTSYYGGGILGRYDLTSGSLSGLYFDVSARMGRAKMDFDSDDIKYNGSDADFDSASLYYGLHGGLGYIWSINEAASLDLSAKLLWTRQESDSVSVRDDKLRFKDADSLRTRLGGRFTYAVSEYVTPYVGAYWEHEFDGKVRSTVNSNGIDAPKLEGNTGMGELGLSFKPAADSALSFDLGVQGYTGQREGVTGSFQVKFEF